MKPPRRQLLLASVVSATMATITAAVLFGVVAAGCFGNIDCTAAHSVFVFATDEVMDLHSCDEWEDATQRYIRDFAEYAQALKYAMPESKVAESIYGITMDVRTGSFPCSYPKGCSGFAYLDMKHIDLALHPEICESFPEIECSLCNPVYSAYYHELTHMVMCEGLGICATAKDNWLHDHPLMHFDSSYYNSCGK